MQIAHKTRQSLMLFLLALISMSINSVSMAQDVEHLDELKRDFEIDSLQRILKEDHSAQEMPEVQEYPDALNEFLNTQIIGSISAKDIQRSYLASWLQSLRTARTSDPWQMEIQKLLDSEAKDFQAQAYILEPLQGLSTAVLQDLYHLKLAREGNPDTKHVSTPERFVHEIHARGQIVSTLQSEEPLSSSQTLDLDQRLIDLGGQVLYHQAFLQIRNFGLPIEQDFLQKQSYQDLIQKAARLDLAIWLAWLSDDSLKIAQKLLHPIREDSFENIFAILYQHPAAHSPSGGTATDDPLLSLQQIQLQRSVEALEQLDNLSDSDEVLLNGATNSLTSKGRTSLLSRGRTIEIIDTVEVNPIRDLAPNPTKPRSQPSPSCQGRDFTPSVRANSFTEREWENVSKNSLASLALVSCKDLISSGSPGAVGGSNACNPNGASSWTRKTLPLPFNSPCSRAASAAGSCACCYSERFEGRPGASHCSAFLITKNHVLTAGHCVVDILQDYRFLFDFNDFSNSAPQFTTEQVFQGKLIAHGRRPLIGNEDWDVGEDWAIVELESMSLNSASRPAEVDLTRRLPAGLAFEAPQSTSLLLSSNLHLYMIGHFRGLPQTISWQGSLFGNPESKYFYNTLDAEQGNSGSMVVDRNTHKILGIAVKAEVTAPLRVDQCEYYGRCRLTSDPRFPATGPNVKCEKGNEVVRLSNPELAAHLRRLTQP